MIINMIEFLENSTVAKYSTKIAVIDGEREIDFLSLTKKAKALAREIIIKNYELNIPIAVFLPKSIEAVIADIAITYSGNIYMNLDVKNPESRINNILNKIKPGIIITNTVLALRLKSFCIDNIIVLNIDETNFTDYSNDEIIFQRLQSIIDTDPYCIINTSGSTGTPKGVVLNHKSFIDFTGWAIDTLKITDEEIIGSLSPCYFDIYSFELCMLMVKGSTIVIIPDQLATFPATLLEYLQQKSINFIFWVPTIMVNIANLDLLKSYELKDLKKIWFAGEVFPTRHLNYWRDSLPHPTFTNLYGPIEITLDCTYYNIEEKFPDDTPIPIGYPFRNTDILILNEEDKVAAINEKGELCVRGTSLAIGYYNDAENTSKAFVQNPLNKSYPEIIYRTGDIVYKNERGLIIFIGRKDFQVKHLGYRIDLSEVEHIIVNTWGKISNACVLYDQEKKQICLFYEANDEIAPSTFRKELMNYLPKYMVPNNFRFLQELPRNSNGKIDRNLIKTMIDNEISS